MVKVNLGCGPVFVNSPDWLNFDFTPASKAVKSANLLDRLPLADESASMVYSSHFLEHVPKSLVPVLLRDWLRVLQPGGVVRIVVPDLENLAREYLNMRNAGEHEKADFVVLEMIDQCVRRESGGELGRLYRQIAVQPQATAAPMIDYIHARTGEDLRASAVSGLSGGGGVCALCDAYSSPCAVASSVIGFDFACLRSRQPSARRTSAWRQWASGTTGCGISIRSRQCSKPLALSIFNAAASTPAQWPTSPSSRWTSMPRVGLARGMSHYT